MSQLLREEVGKKQDKQDEGLCSEVHSLGKVTSHWHKFFRDMDLVIIFHSITWKHLLITL